MPTAAKLFAAAFMSLGAAGLIYVVVDVYPLIEFRFLPMQITVAIVGALVGWRGLGAQMKTDETKNGVMLGFRAGFSVYVWTMVLFALNHMKEGIERHAYYQPLDALLQIPLRMMEFGYNGFALPIIIPAFILSMLAGVWTKQVSLRWP